MVLAISQLVSTVEGTESYEAVRLLLRRTPRPQVIFTVFYWLFACSYASRLCTESKTWQIFLLWRLPIWQLVYCLLRRQSFSQWAWNYLVYWGCHKRTLLERYLLRLNTINIDRDNFTVSDGFTFRKCFPARRGKKYYLPERMFPFFGRILYLAWILFIFMKAYTETPEGY